MKRIIPFFVTLVTLASLAFAGEVETRVSSQDLSEGQTFQMLLRYRGDSPAAPELAELKQDFDVLDISQGTRSSIINGVRDDSTDWTLTLVPHGKGVFTVPEIQVGDAHSATFEVRVSAATAGASATGANADGSGPPVIFEVEVDNSQPYVQAQVMLTARVLLDSSIREGALTEPELDGALLERSGEDRTSTIVRDGKSYTQIERRYALFPQRSGKVHIPPLSFEAVQRSSKRRSRSSFNDPFGGSPFDDFFGGSSPFDDFFGGGSPFDDFFDQGRRVRFQSNSIELDVRQKPEAAKSTWWLPARHVQLVESFEPDPPVFRVGEEVTRHISIQALGLSGSQLPTLQLPPVKGLKQYPQPALNDTLLSGDDAIAVRSQEIELVPTRAGEMVLPAIEVKWWDLEADQARTARLPERRVQVLAGDGSVVASVAPEPAPPVVPPVETPPVSDDAAWPYGLGAAGALLLLALGYFINKRRVARRGLPSLPALPSLHKVEARLARACKSADPAAVAAALADVARVRWPEDPPLNPTAFAQRLEDEQLEQAVDTLERARFSDDQSPWDGAAFWQAYTTAKRGRRKRLKHASTSPLPTLYPAA